MESVDKTDLKSVGEIRVGSNPTCSTIWRDGANRCFIHYGFEFHLRQHLKGVTNQAYRSGGRNYLLRVTYSIDRPRMIEWWDKEQECWRT